MLDKLNQWINARADKVPFDATTGKTINAHDTRNHLTYAEALRRSTAYGCLIGFDLQPFDGVGCLDIDGCRNPETGELNALAQATLARFPGAFYEISISGTGLHLWMRCNKQLFLDRARKFNGVEFYVDDRYIAIGQYVSGDFSRDWTAELLDFVPLRTTLPGLPQQPVAPTMTVNEATARIQLAMRSHSAAAAFGSKASVSDLVNGNEDALALHFPSPTGDKYDRSSADAALMAHLAFWFEKHPGNMELAFGLTALGKRAKWLDRGDYRASTIGNAIAGCNKIYQSRALPTPTATGLANIYSPQNDITENAVALAVAEQFQGRLLYVGGQWWVWSGSTWIPDDVQFAYALVREFCNRETGGIGKFTSVKFINAVLKHASTDPRLVARSQEFDSDDWLLNTPGGVYDLRADTMSPHGPKFRMTKITGVAPDFNMPTPVWDRFLHRIFAGDQEMIAFVYRMMGYFLTGDISEEVLPFCYGLGGNGKSKFVEAISFVMGDYGTVTASETLMAKYGSPGHPTELASLKGARLVTATEVEDGRKWDEARIKSLTGGDRISARLMRENFSSWKPTFKLLVSGNHRPQIRAVDDAIRRRMLLIPFGVTIPAAERDLKLEEKLRAEGPGILAAMIRGCLEWQRIGIAPPSAVTSATNEYLNDQDFIGEFLREKCDLTDPNARTSTQQLYSFYLAHARDNREPELNKINFAQKLSEKRDLGIVKSDTRTERGFRGIKIRNGVPVFGATVPRQG